MITHFCQTGHNPPHSYGDCVRACVASLLNVEDPLSVPHFFHDNDPHVGMARIVEWLEPQGLLPFYIAYPPSDTLEDVLHITGTNNPSVYHILFGGTDDGGDHVVICQNGKVVHNPGVGSIITKPTSSNMWIIMVIVRA